MPIITSFLVTSLSYLNFDTQEHLYSRGFPTLLTPIVYSRQMLSCCAPHFIHSFALDKKLANFFLEFSRQTIKYCSVVSLLEPLDSSEVSVPLAAPIAYSRTEEFLSVFLNLKTISLSSFMKLTSSFIRRVILEKHYKTVQIFVLDDCNSNPFFISDNDECVLDLLAEMLLFDPSTTSTSPNRVVQKSATKEKEQPSRPPPPPESSSLYDFNSFKKPILCEKLVQHILFQMSNSKTTSPIVRNMPRRISGKNAKTSKKVFPLLASFIACPLSFSTNKICKEITDFAIYGLRNLIINNELIQFDDFSALGVFEALRFALQCFDPDTQSQAMYLLVSILGESLLILKQNDSCCSKSVNSKRHFVMSACAVSRISDFFTPPSCYEVEDILKQAIDIALSLDENNNNSDNDQDQQKNEDADQKTPTTKIKKSKLSIKRALAVAPPVLMLLKFLLIYSPRINLRPLILKKWKFIQKMIPWATNFEIDDDDDEEEGEKVETHDNNNKKIQKEINETGYELFSWILFKTEHDDNLVRVDFGKKYNNKNQEKNKKQEIQTEEEQQKIMVKTPQDKILHALCEKSFKIFGLLTPGNVFSCLVQLLGFQVAENKIDFCEPASFRFRRAVVVDESEGTNNNNNNVSIRNQLKSQFIASHLSNDNEKLMLSFRIASKLINEYNIVETILTKGIRFYGKIIIDRQINEHGFEVGPAEGELLFFDNCARVLCCLDILTEAFREKMYLFQRKENNDDDDDETTKIRFNLRDRIDALTSVDSELKRSFDHMKNGASSGSHRYYPFV